MGRSGLVVSAGKHRPPLTIRDAPRRGKITGRVKIRAVTLMIPKKDVGKNKHTWVLKT
jgi:hypothetical protein